MEIHIISAPNKHFYLHTGTEIGIGIGIFIEIDYTDTNISKHKGITHFSTSCFTSTVITLHRSLSNFYILCVVVPDTATKYLHSVLCFIILIHFSVDSREANMHIIVISLLLLCRFIASVLATNSRM